jgi:hypothetical protein
MDNKDKRQISNDNYRDQIHKMGPKNLREKDERGTKPF